jgi:DNA polymerase III subunit gamma/tau
MRAMSYLVLARKYRPLNFAQMVGQEHVVQALSNALTQQRLHHAYLFTGTRGVGKTTVSRVLAKSLNCTGLDGLGGITAQPCGRCQACTEIDSGRFVDYIELDAASNRGVDEVQALLEQAVYKPVQGRFKVFMIDEVHMLTNTAFNAMLKTLEEPPGYLKFVLATTDPQKVPVTVLSRCLQFNLRPMAPETVQHHLASVLGQEAIAADTGSLRLLARAARGSMRDALSLTDQAIAFGSGALVEAQVRQMLGSVDRSHVFTLIGALAQGDGRAVLQTIDQLRLHGLSATGLLDDMSGVLQRMAVEQVVPGGLSSASADGAGDPDVARMVSLAQDMPADETQLLYSLCLQGKQELGLAPDEYAGLTMVLLRLLAFKPSDVSGAAEKKSLKPAPSPPVEPNPALPVAPVASVSLTTTPTRFSQSAKPVLSDARTGGATESIALYPYTESDKGEISADFLHATPVVPAGGGPVLALESSEHAGGAHSPDTGTAVVVPFARQPPVALQLASETPAGGGLLRMPLRGEAGTSPLDQPKPLAPVGGAQGPGVVSGPTVVRKGSDDGLFWFDTVNALIARELIAALVRELALQSQLVARDADSQPPRWLLRVERESLTQMSTRERLQAALAQLGHAVHIDLEGGVVSDSPARRLHAVAARRQRAAERLVQTDGYVQQLQAQWGARVVSGSIKPTG